MERVGAGFPQKKRQRSGKNGHNRRGGLYFPAPCLPENAKFCFGTLRSAVQDENMLSALVREALISSRHTQAL
jgi:hypothetical protein